MVELRKAAEIMAGATPENSYVSALLNKYGTHVLALMAVIDERDREIERLRDGLENLVAHSPVIMTVHGWYCQECGERAYREASSDDIEHQGCSWAYAKLLLNGEDAPE